MSLAAVFIDRDGTIIEDSHYPKDPEKVVLLSNAVEGLKLMREKGYLLFVISNQSGVGRGLIKDEEFRQVHERFCQLLKESQLECEGVADCLHHPEDRCHCRKPEIDLIPKIFNNQPISWKESFTVGDKLSDLELADNIGAKGCLVLSGKGQETLLKLNSFNRSNHYPTFPDLLSVAKSLPNRAGNH